MQQQEYAYPPIRHLIGGRYHGGETGRGVVNPATDETMGVLPLIDDVLLDKLAKTAFVGFKRWRATPSFERAQVLKKAVNVMRQRVDFLAWIITNEQGKILSEARAEILGTAAIFDWLAEESCRIGAEILSSRLPGFQQSIHHEPIGPVLAIAPWNMPAMMAGRKIAHALATGCSVIVKPSSETPATSLLLAEILLEAGLPTDVIHVIHGNADKIAQYLIPRREVRKVSFTGSTETGRQLGSLCGYHIKKFTAELGGHAPVIITPDADCDSAAKMLAQGKFFNAGQSCMVPTRFLVHQSCLASFRENFVAYVAKIRVGNGLEEEHDMGAIINKNALRSMRHFVEDACGHGAKLLHGGDVLGETGSFFAPTILDQVSPRAKIMNEEPYGPLAALTAYDTRQEAIDITNALPFGLCAYIFGSDHNDIQKMAAEIEAGLVGINTLNVGGPMVPFGGVKDSGLGREGSRYGLYESMVSKTVSRQD